MFYALVFRIGHWLLWMDGWMDGWMNEQVLDARQNKTKQMSFWEWDFRYMRSFRMEWELEVEIEVGFYLSSVRLSKLYFGFWIFVYGGGWVCLEKNV